MKNKIYLASKSPRRQTLLRQINVDFELIDSEIDESVETGELALNYVRRMSIQKAKAGWRSKQRVELFPLLAADTSIAIDSVILGKAASKDEARVMLCQLSDSAHEVITSVSIIYLGKDRHKHGYANQEKIETIDSITKVKICKLSDLDIENYLQTNEWIDKAGSYAIQGFAAKYIESINGSYSGVVGLPLFETNLLIKSALGTK